MRDEGRKFHLRNQWPHINCLLRKIQVFLFPFLLNLLRYFLLLLLLLIPKWIFLLLWDKGNVLVLFIPSLKFFPLKASLLPTGLLLLLFLLQKNPKVYGRPLLILNGEGLWLKRRRHSKWYLGTCSIAWRERPYLWWGRGWPIVGGGCILSNSCLMDRLKDIKLVLLQRDSPIN